MDSFRRDSRFTSREEDVDAADGGTGFIQDGIPKVVRARFLLTLVVPLSRSVSEPSRDGDCSLLDSPERIDVSLRFLSRHHPPIQSPMTEPGRVLLSLLFELAWLLILAFSIVSLSVDSASSLRSIVSDGRFVAVLEGTPRGVKASAIASVRDSDTICDGSEISTGEEVEKHTSCGPSNGDSFKVSSDRISRTFLSVGTDFGSDVFINSAIFRRFIFSPFLSRSQLACSALSASS
jgi:hypothetical protein